MSVHPQELVSSQWPCCVGGNREWWGLWGLAEWPPLSSQLPELLKFSKGVGNSGFSTTSLSLGIWAANSSLKQQVG